MTDSKTNRVDPTPGASPEPPPGGGAALRGPSLRERVFYKFNPPEGGMGRVDQGITWLIIANVLTIVVELEGSLVKGNEAFFHWFEVFSSIAFSIEYVARVWITPLDPRYAKLGPVLGRLRYMVSFMALVDLVSVLPFYLSFVKMDLRAVRSLRLLRLLRLIKLARSEEFRLSLHRKLNPDEGTSAIDSFIIVLIALNVLMVIMETEESISGNYHQAFHLFEFFSTIIFSCEYLVRIWIADLDPRYQKYGRFGSRLRYILSFMAMIDLIAILPFYLRTIQMDLRIARAIRLLRLVRILKIGRYAHAVTTLSRVFARKKEELAISTFVTVMILILCSSAMYFIEHEAQTEAFRSIPAAMWWAIVTLTSVGYGDISPVTPVGKFVGAIICMVGVLLVAIPTGILASGFAEEIEDQKAKDREEDEKNFTFCPHCGEHLGHIHEQS